MTRSPGFYFLFFIFQIHSKWEWETASTCFVGFCTCVCIYLSKERKRNGRRGWISDLFFAPTNWKSIYHPIPQLPVFEVLAGILLRTDTPTPNVCERLCRALGQLLCSPHWGEWICFLTPDSKKSGILGKNRKDSKGSIGVVEIPKILIMFQRF